MPDISYIRVQIFGVWLLIGIIYITAYETQDWSDPFVNSFGDESHILGSISEHVQERGHKLHPSVLLSNTNLQGNEVNENTAVVFVNDLYDIKVCCEPQKCTTGTDLTFALCANQSKEHAPPRLLGTYAKRIKVEYEGEKYDKVRSGTLMEPITVTMVDVFNREAPQRGTLTIKPESLGVTLAGAPATGMIINGTSRVEGLLMTAKPGNYTLTIIVQTFESKFAVLRHTIEVEVQHCTVGEAPKVNGTFCEMCRPNFYNFNLTAVDCTKCPIEGIFCPGPIVIPRDGWWHSSSHSPAVKPCIIERACQYEGRAEILGNASLRAGEKELKWDDPNYDQCGSVRILLHPLVQMCHILAVTHMYDSCK